MRDDLLQIVEKQRAYWRSGATLSLASRKAAIQSLKNLLTENRDVIAEAQFKDIRRVCASFISSPSQSKTSNMELLMAPFVFDEALAKIEEWAATTVVYKKK